MAPVTYKRFHIVKLVAMLNVGYQPEPNIEPDELSNHARYPEEVIETRDLLLTLIRRVHEGGLKDGYTTASSSDS